MAPYPWQRKCLKGAQWPPHRTEPIDFCNLCLASNLPYLDKVLKHVAAMQLQSFLNDTDFPYPFQAGFRPGFSIETALVTLMDDLRKNIDRRYAFLFV